jgi:hypothetical protein
MLQFPGFLDQDHGGHGETPEDIERDESLADLHHESVLSSTKGVRSRRSRPLVVYGVQ